MEGDVVLDYCQLSIGFLKHVAIVTFWMAIRNSEIDAENMIELCQHKSKVIESNGNKWAVCGLSAIGC